MKRHGICILLVSVFSVVLFAPASPAEAIYNGSVLQPLFAPVGEIRLSGYAGTFCTGTLIAPQLVLTAAHCLVYGDNLTFSIPVASGAYIYFISYEVSTSIKLGYYSYLYTLSGIQMEGGPNDIAVLVLSTPIPSNYAVPVAITLQPLPAGQSVVRIGYGKTCPECNDIYDQQQRGAIMPLNQSNIGCSGDSGGPILWTPTGGTPQIYAVSSNGACGIVGFRDIDADPEIYYSELQSLIAKYGGPPYCTASISPTSGYSTTQFTASFSGVGSSATCSYALDNKGFQPLSSCSVTSMKFLGSTLGEAEHDLAFKIQNSAGSYTCPTSSFTVYPALGNPVVTIPPQSASVQPNVPTIFTANVTGNSGTVTYNWYPATLAQAPSTGNLFASVFLGALKTLTSWLPLPAFLSESDSESSAPTFTEQVALVQVTDGEVLAAQSPKFQIGDRVQVTTKLNVRSTPNGKVLGTQSRNALGAVIGGPTVASGFTWWKINYDISPDGWSAENYLTKVSSPPPSELTTKTAATGPTTCGNTSSCAITFPTAGTWTVKVLATDFLGQSATAYQNVVVGGAGTGGFTSQPPPVTNSNCYHAYGGTHDTLGAQVYRDAGLDYRYLCSNDHWYSCGDGEWPPNGLSMNAPFGTTATNGMHVVSWYCDLPKTEWTKTPPTSPPICGNDIAETGEQCDGADLNNQTCTTQGFSSGTLSCTSSCTFNTSSCTTPPIQLPDLTAGDPWIPPGITAEQTIQFNDSVTNTSAVHAGASDVSFKVNGVSVLGSPFAVSDLDPWTSSPQVFANWTAGSAGNYVLQVCVDVNGAVAESNESESSNCFSEPFTVSSPPLPPTAPTCSASPSTVYVNKTTTLSASGGDGSYTWSIPGGSPSSGSGSSIATSYSTRGSKTVTVTSGGKSGVCYVTVKRFGTITFSATLNGSPWTGSVVVNGTTPNGASTNLTVPTGSYPNAPIGAYTYSYVSGGPSGATFQSITSSASQTLSEGSTITFTFNFVTTIVTTATVHYRATLNGSPWSGPIHFISVGTNTPTPWDGTLTFPTDVPNAPSGITWTETYVSGGPTGATFKDITPSDTQSITTGDITFTFNFSNQSSSTSSTSSLASVLSGLMRVFKQVTGLLKIY